MVSFSRIGGRCCAPEVAGRINSMPRAKRRITWSWVKIVMNVPPRVNGRRALAPRNDQDLARPVLLVPSQRSSLRHEHIIARAVDPIGAVGDSDLAEPPSAGASPC